MGFSIKGMLMTGLKMGAAFISNAILGLYESVKNGETGDEVKAALVTLFIWDRYLLKLALRVDNEIVPDVVLELREAAESVIGEEHVPYLKSIKATPSGWPVSDPDNGGSGDLLEDLKVSYAPMIQASGAVSIGGGSGGDG